MTVKLTFIATLLMALACGFFLADKSNSQDRGIYSCGMHQQVIQDRAGNCPICNMKLERVHRGEVEMAHVPASGGQVVVDPLMIQKSGIRSSAIVRSAIGRTIRAYAWIDFDETRISEATTLFRGRIEKSFVDAAGQAVRRGEPLFEIFSPELFTAQTEYMMAVSAAQLSGGTNAAQRLTNMAGMSGGSAKMRAAARLKALDFSDEQIAKMERGPHDARKGLTIASPSDGVVIEKSIARGQTVESGMRLLRIADLSVVWAVAEVFEDDLRFIKPGEEADLTISDAAGKKVKARVAFINPLLDEKSRTAKVRLEIPNGDRALKPGMYASVELHAEISADALVIPDSAVLRSGRRNTVFVALESGKFEVREVTLGARGDDDVYEVVGGLSEGDRVVTSGQFLLDSESQLRVALNTISPQSQREAAPMAPTVSSDKIIYTCPMAEHGAVRNSHAGKCPLCNMTLVPISETAYNKITEEKWLKEHPAGR